MVIASKPMAESYIIAEMMGQLIEANSDIKVEYKMGIGGGTSNIQPAMETGEIDMYPEYTGTGWLFVLKNELVTDAEALYEGVKTQYQEKYNFVWLDRYGFNDTYALAIDKTKADNLGINTFSDLAGQISDEEMQQMNCYVEKENRDAGDVAAEFLKAEGLL